MKKALVFLLFCVVFVTMAACGNSAPGGGTSQPGGAVPTPELPSSANYPSSVPTGSTSGSGNEIDNAKYGGVVKLIETGDTNRPFGLTWQPLFATMYSAPWSEALLLFSQAGDFTTHLAESFDVDLDANTITFVLKQGIYFSDGSPFNAEAVVWNMKERNIDLRGNEDVDYDNIQATGEYTVVVQLNNWQNALMNEFASHSFSIVSMENAVKNGKEFASLNPVGTGPFKLKEWTPGASLIFERNPDYWMEGKPYLDGIEYHAITDVMTQNAAIMSSGNDAIDYFASGNAEQTYTLINQDIDFDYSYMRTGSTICLVPNSVDQDGNPFYDVRVRQALAFAIDRDTLTEARGFGILKPAYQLTSTNFAGNLKEGHPELIISYDPDKARALLAEAGYPDGFSTKLFAGQNFRDEMTIIQSMLGQIGIVVDMEFPEPGALSVLHNNGWEGILNMGFGQIPNTPIGYFIWYHPTQNTYVSAMRPPEYESLYLDARRSFHVEDELCGKLSEMVLRHMTFVPMYHTYTTYFIRNGFKDHGFTTQSSDTIWLPWDAYWEK